MTSPTTKAVADQSPSCRFKPLSVCSEFVTVMFRKIFDNDKKVSLSLKSPLLQVPLPQRRRRHEALQRLSSVVSLFHTKRRTPSLRCFCVLCDAAANSLNSSRKGISLTPPQVYQSEKLS
jgi:hypothetical protein